MKYTNNNTQDNNNNIQHQILETSIDLIIESDIDANTIPKWEKKKNDITK